VGCISIFSLCSNLICIIGLQIFTSEFLRRIGFSRLLCVIGLRCSKLLILCQKHMAKTEEEMSIAVILLELVMVYI